MLTEAAKQVSDLPDNANVTIQVTDDWMKVTLMSPPGHYAMIRADKKYSDCLKAWEIVSANASGGFGPLIYDIAMELAGKDGLMCDRHSVSSEAGRVWDFYLKNRPDITHKQLDYNRHPFVTPNDTSDDCLAKTFSNDKEALEKADPGSDGQFSPRTSKKHRDLWLSHWGTKVYYKSDTAALDAHEAANKVKFV